MRHSVAGAWRPLSIPRQHASDELFARPTDAMNCGICINHPVHYRTAIFPRPTFLAERGSGMVPSSTIELRGVVFVQQMGR
jgi:hypothetical protein